MWFQNRVRGHAGWLRKVRLNFYGRISIASIGLRDTDLPQFTNVTNQPTTSRHNLSHVWEARKNLSYVREKKLLKYRLLSEW